MIEVAQVIRLTSLLQSTIDYFGYLKGKATIKLSLWHHWRTTFHLILNVHFETVAGDDDMATIS